MKVVDKEGDGSTNIELEKKAKMLKLRNFRGVFMRDELAFRPLSNESGILNLNTSNQAGSHWVCWFKDANKKYYFDSFGVPPPRELVSYLKLPILYSTYQIQQFGDTNCGEWCLYVLDQLNRKRSFVDTVMDIHVI